MAFYLSNSRALCGTLHDESSRRVSQAVAASLPEKN
jgi:hypothetical protein